MHLREDAVGAGIVAVLILALFAGAEVLGRALRLPVEWTRKGTHVGAGAVVLTFPWLLSHTVTLVLLAGSFAGILVGGRLTGLLGSVHGVERRTGGAYFYPLAVLGTWVLSGGDPLLFCVPLAVMAVADTGAALVGQQAGQARYPVMDGERSVEGSIAFFVLAFGITLSGGALAGTGWPDVLLVALVVASLTTAAEAISVRGSDNLAVPYAAWMALQHTQRLGLEALGDWILAMSLGLGALLLTAPRARLSVAGAVALFMATTLAWALGGARWLVPLTVLYGLYLLARPSETGLDRVFPTTVGPMVVLLAYAHLGDPSLYVAYLAAVAATGAIAGRLVAAGRGWPVPVVATAAGLAPLALAWAVYPEAPVVLPLAGAALGLAIYEALGATRLVGRRLVASLVAAGGAWWVVAG